MANFDELRRQEESLRKEQEKKRITKEEKMRDDDILKRQKFAPDNPNLKEDQKLSKKDTKASPHAPIFPCAKCRRSHKKGQACKGP